MQTNKGFFGATRDSGPTGGGAGVLEEPPALKTLKTQVYCFFFFFVIVQALPADRLVTSFPGAICSNSGKVSDFTPG